MGGCSGVVRRRTLRRVPDRRCWLVGHCCCDGDGDDAVAAAGRFSERWPTGLVVGEHDCRDYTNGNPSGRRCKIVVVVRPVSSSLCFVFVDRKGWSRSSQVKIVSWSRSDCAATAPPAAAPAGRRRRGASASLFPFSIFVCKATPRFLRSRGAPASVYLNFHRDWRYGFQFFGDVACAQSDDATVF
jgi:hypothetical protein